MAGGGGPWTISGAATGLGFRLAAACARCGYGVILTDDAPTLSLEAGGSLPRPAGGSSGGEGVGPGVGV